MPARYRRSYATSRRPRRELAWARFSFTDNARATGTHNTFDLLSGYRGLGGSTQGATVMAVHIQGSYAAASTGGNALIGIGVTHLSDITPDLPNTAEAGADWMLLRAIFPQSAGATVDAATPWEVHLKSRRKCHQIQQTLFLTWTPTDTGTSSLNFVGAALLALG